MTFIGHPSFVTLAPKFCANVRKLGDVTAFNSVFKICIHFMIQRLGQIKNNTN